MRNYNIDLKQEKMLVWEQAKWIRGLNKLVSNTQIRDDELSDALNIQLVEDGKVQCPRDGQAYYGNSSGSQVTGLFPFYKSDGTKQLLRFSGTKLQKYNTSTEDWDDVSGYTYTSGADMIGVTAYDRLYLVNGVDPLTYYDGTSITTFTEIDKPTGFGLTRGAGSSGSYTYSYKIEAYTTTGRTEATSAQEITMSVDELDSSNKIDLAWTASSGAAGYHIFGRKDGQWYHLKTLEGGSSVSWTDDGTSTPNELFLPATANTTSGPTGTHISVYKDSLFVLGDPSDPSRLHYSGGGDNIHDFSIAGGGGFIDVAKNNGQTLTASKLFKDSLIVFKTEQTYQFSFSTAGLPQITLVNDAVGCISPRGVEAVENDLFMVNRRGIFTLGNQEGFAFDVLRTNEISSRIRSEFESIDQSRLNKVAVIYATKENKNLVIFAYTPAGGTYNSKAIIYDRERLAWYIWDNIQANCWAQYTDSNGDTHVLYGDDNSGYVKEVLTGNKDFGSNISAHFRLKAVSFSKGGINKYKKLKDVDVVLREPTGSLKLSVIKDGVTSEYSTTLATINPSVNWGHYSFPLVPGVSIGSGVTPQDENLLKTLKNINIQGRSFMLEFDNQGSGQFTLLFAGLLAKPRSSRFRMSTDLVSV